MNNTLSKAELCNDLLYDTLRTLYDIFSSSGLDLYVVGALARDLAFKLLDIDASPRKTLDLDIAVALKDWAQFDMVCESLRNNHFEKTNAKQKFIYKGIDGENDYEVDIVPFGDIAENEIIQWPPEKHPEMSVRCYEDIMRHAADIHIDDIKLKMAPLAGQFFLKMDAWIDRNDREEKDAIDMVYIMGKYYSAKIFQSELEDMPEAVDIYNIDPYMLMPGAQWIACDAAAMLSKAHLEYYADFLNQNIRLNENSRLMHHLTIGREDDPDFWETTLKALASIRDIFLKELDNRN